MTAAPRTWPRPTKSPQESYRYAWSLLMIFNHNFLCIWPIGSSSPLQWDAIPQCSRLFHSNSVILCTYFQAVQNSFQLVPKRWTAFGWYTSWFQNEAPEWCPHTGMWPGKGKPHSPRQSTRKWHCKVFTTTGWSVFYAASKSTRLKPGSSGSLMWAMLHIKTSDNNRNYPYSTFIYKKFFVFRL